MKADVHPNLAELYRPKVAQLGKFLDEETARPPPRWPNFPPR